MPPDQIDYYGALNTVEAKVGDTAIFAFRTQVFVTNAHIAILKNVSEDPELIGVFDIRDKDLCTKSKYCRIADFCFNCV